ncbi:class III lanthipeptide [Streptomyces zhihengii]|uniref:class III lanthipeptide n=1 Tax=Streptomyces zhihengii TaxID=1818004 RepID=UPI00360B62BC
MALTRACRPAPEATAPSARPAQSTTQEVSRMSVLKLQNLQPSVTPSRAAVISVTSSSSTCCSTKPN